MAENTGWIQQLSSGKYILASWVPCACEWYAVGAETDDGAPVTAGSVAELGRKRRVPKYATIEDAQRALEAFEAGH